jgi:hypothetical protein
MKILESHKILSMEIASAVKSFYQRPEPDVSAPPDYSSLTRKLTAPTPTCPELDLDALDLNGAEPGNFNLYPEISSAPVAGSSSLYPAIA